MMNIGIVIIPFNPLTEQVVVDQLLGTITISPFPSTTVIITVTDGDK